jgi:CheY-like chemotaxis protein
MPGLSGVELQSMLNPHGARVPIIFITAFPEDRIRRCVFEAGAVGFLSKPFEEAACVLPGIRGGQLFSARHRFARSFSAGVMPADCAIAAACASPTCAT